ncbi:hypothetical protein HYR69_08230, partial [Candidatus Sumerlaeota bacterium]|nr:hypothetical protein [Candidatus Sumerlaeota bacterium]
HFIRRRRQKTSEDNYHAGVMFPWVNRIGGDKWSCEGVPVPVNLSGPLTHLHGLVGDLDWEIQEVSKEKVAYHVVLEAQKFYPRRLDAVVTYAIVSIANKEALEVKIAGRNLESAEVAYITTGIHPYFLNPFGGKVDEMELFCAAAKEFSVDERLIPTGIIEVTPEHDFRKSRPIGATQFDSGFIIQKDANPAAEIKIKNFRLTITPIANCGYAQIYIPPHREEIAIEPQSGGADAFRFHQFGLARLKPGEGFAYTSRLTAVFS